MQQEPGNLELGPQVNATQLPEPIMQRTAPLSRRSFLSKTGLAGGAAVVTLAGLRTDALAVTSGYESVLASVVYTQTTEVTVTGATSEAGATTSGRNTMKQTQPSNSPSGGTAGSEQYTAIPDSWDFLYCTADTGGSIDSQPATTTVVSGTAPTAVYTVKVTWSYTVTYHYGAPGTPIPGPPVVPWTP